MPLLNYTTGIQASRSIAEICRILQEGGASAIMLENGPDREIIAVSFMLETTFGRVPFTIPANVPAVILALNAQIKAESQKRGGYRRKIPTSLYNNKAQAERIAWRIAKDWLEAQIAIHEIGSAKLEQIMLPFATVGGKSFYARLVERGSLALPSGESSEPKNITEV
jgi:hypothetical protein